MKFNKIILILMLSAALLCMTAVSAADDIVPAMDDTNSIAADIDEQISGENDSDFEPAGQENENDLMAASDDDNLTEDGGEFVDTTEAYYYLNEFRREKGAWYWEIDDVSKVYFNTLDTNQLEPLVRNEALEETAKIRAKEIAEVFSHTRPDGSSFFTAYPDYPMPTGECIARGYRTCEDVTEAWKETNEPFDGQGHRREMLDPLSNCVGIAGYKDKYGVIYWVQDYGYDSNYTSSNVEYLVSTVNLDVPDIVKSYYDSEKKLNITLTDAGTPISNATLKIEIDGKNLTATTDSNGKAFVDSDLAIGVHKAVVSWGNIAATSKIKISPIYINVSDSTGFYGNTGLTATLTNNSVPLVDEDLSVRIWGVATYYLYTDSNGAVDFNLNDLDAGVYDADVFYKDISEKIKITVNKVPTSISSSWKETSRNSGSVKASLTPALPDVEITFSVGGKNYTMPLKDGEASLDLSDLTVGDYCVKATYAGDVNHEAADTTIEFRIADVKIRADDLTKCYSEPGNFTAILTKDGKPYAYADVSISISNISYSKTTDKNGMVSLPVDFESGTYDATAVFEDLNAKAKITINKIATETGLSYVQTSYDKAILTSSITPYIKSGNVTFYVDGERYEGIINDSAASLKLKNLKPGNHTAGAVYAGDRNHEASSANVTLIIPEYDIRISADDLTKFYTGNKQFGVGVTYGQDKPLVNESVEITIAGNTYARTTDENGRTSLKIDLPPKTYTAEVTCANTSVTSKIVVKSIITAKNVNAKRSAKTLKITVSLKKVNGKYLKNKKVTLKFNKKTIKAKTNKKGAVTFTIKKNVYSKLKAGKKYTYQVTYGKDSVKKSIKFKN